MNKFHKVSFQQYVDDTDDNRLLDGGLECMFDLGKEYDSIKLPKRATAASAGYDFYAPFSFTLQPGQSIKFPTGIRVQLDDDKFLGCFPRSGLGFKFKTRLANTVGIVDADYFTANNEGHIHVRLCNEGDKDTVIAQGDAFMQGIIMPFFKTDDDEASGVRVGGFGSTDA
ncbi:Deoxyuridine 5'-triphosphate nucleotidohydrolase [bioreactor metagenome]|uniref:dUTP diphosphatase n=1 Tax=bioreactor metagenome TaxID=1076179 RepID=A0A644WWV7_9ZZZZ